MFRFILPGIAAGAMLIIQTIPAAAVEVYLFKGAGDFSFVAKGLHFSKGLQRITDTLNEEGIHAELRRASGVDDAYRTIIKRRPESVAFIGHSMGALASLSIARRMRAEGIRVAYIGLIDIPGPVGVAGDNVEWAENYYSIHPVYGKLTNTRSHPNAKNIHVSGQIHTTMDDSREVREGMLAAIRKVHAEEQGNSPVPAQPETLMVENQVETVPQKRLLKIDEDPVVATASNTSYDVQSAPKVAVTTHSGSQTFENPSDLPPLPLPSVSGAARAAPLNQQAEIDPNPTASVEDPALVRAGKGLLGRARGFISRLNRSREMRAQSYQR